MKKQNNQLRKSPLSAGNLTIIAVLFVLLTGCSNLTKNLQENVNGKDTASNSSPNTSAAATPTASPTAEATPKAANLAEDIVGKWEMKRPDGKTVVFDFAADKNVESIVDGKSASKGTYRIVDEKTVETKNTDGNVLETLGMKIEGDKMTMTYEGSDLHLTKQ